TDTWDRPRADRGAWRRQDTVWLSLRLGFAARVERVLEQREPARTEASQRGTLRYDLESSLPVPGGLAEDRRLEAPQALSLRAAAGPAPTPAGRDPPPTKKSPVPPPPPAPPPPSRGGSPLSPPRPAPPPRGGPPPAGGAPAPDPPAPAAPAVIALGKPAPDFL